MKKRSIKQNVESILNSNEEARCDDTFLFLAYWKEIDKIDMNNFENEFITKATKPESIRRARQLIQGEGKCLPPEHVINARHDKENAMRMMIRNEREVI